MGVNLRQMFKVSQKRCSRCYTMLYAAVCRLMIWPRYILHTGSGCQIIVSIHDVNLTSYVKIGNKMVCNGFCCKKLYSNVNVCHIL